MTEVIALSRLLQPLISQIQPRSLLVAGETVHDCVKELNDTRSTKLTSPFSQQQLLSIQAVDLAIVSDITETLSVQQGQQWLGMLRNQFAPHIILVSDTQRAAAQGWQFTDLIALGLKHIAGDAEGLQIYSYAIDSYQGKKDWLNSRFWANPENYDKYRW
jgi:hypothetical protein